MNTLGEVILSPIRLEDLKILIREAVEDALRGYTPENLTKDMLNLEEACEFVGLKKSTIYGKVSRREIPHSKKGKNLYFSRSELDAYLREGKRKSISEIEKEADQYMSKKSKTARF